MRFNRLSLALLWFFGLAGAAWAQTSADRAISDAWSAAYAKGTVGPALINLGGVATLQLPKAFVFVPSEQGELLLRGMGNAAGASLLGVVVPAENHSSWYMPITLSDTGHVGGHAVAQLDTEEIRGSMATAARSGNETRRQLGASPIDVGAFLEPPKSDEARHTFTTAVRIYETGPTMADEDGAIVAMKIFGRTQTLDVSLVDGLGSYTKHRAAFEAVAQGLAFAPGQRSEDFVAGTDPVAPRLLDVLFEGKTRADIAAEEDAAKKDAARIAALPPPKSFAKETKLALFGVLGVFALLMVILAFSRGEQDQPQRLSGTDRLRGVTRR